MKPFLLSTLLLFSVASSVAQNTPNLDHLMTQRLVRCEDVELNAVALFAQYLPDSQYDSARMLVAYWIQRCGYTPENFRMEVLLQIENKTYDENKYGDKLLNSLLDLRDPEYHPLPRINSPTGEELEHLEIHSKLIQIAAMLSRTLGARSDLSEYERLMITYVGGNYEPLLLALKENKLQGTHLQLTFNRERYRTEEAPESTFTVLLEHWIPTGNAKILGTHPGLGLGIGTREKRMTYDLVFSVRFLNTRDHYRVLYRDSLYVTNYFVGIYAGGEVGYAFHQNKKSEWRVLGGIGFEGFQSLKPQNEEDEPSKTIRSLNMNGGIGYRRFNRKTGRFIGLEARLNVLSFNNAGGTNLDGNAVSIRLTSGRYNNPWNNARKKALGLD